jgi:hypothetical protein
LGTQHILFEAETSLWETSLGLRQETYGAVPFCKSNPAPDPFSIYRTHQVPSSAKINDRFSDHLLKRKRIYYGYFLSSSSIAVFKSSELVTPFLNWLLINIAGVPETPKLVASTVSVSIMS